MKISVVTLSVRPEGLKIVEKALRRQTERSFDWVIGTPTKPDVGIEHIWIQDPPKPEGLYWQVYRQYNECIRQSRGDLIVSVQDYTYFNPDALEKFLFYHEKEPKTLVTGVGNKYTDETWLSKTWQDPRERTDQGTLYGCYYNDIEWNFCAVPKEAIYAVGGWDETLDKYSSLCGLDVLARINLIGGYDFKIDQTNKSYSLEHGRLPNWEESSPFRGVWQNKLEEYKKQPVLDFLKKGVILDGIKVEPEKGEPDA